MAEMYPVWLFSARNGGPAGHSGGEGRAWGRAGPSCCASAGCTAVCWLEQRSVAAAQQPPARPPRPYRPRTHGGPHGEDEVGRKAGKEEGVAKGRVLDGRVVQPRVPGGWGVCVVCGGVRGWVGVQASAGQRGQAGPHVGRPAAAGAVAERSREEQQQRAAAGAPEDVGAGDAAHHPDGRPQPGRHLAAVADEQRGAADEVPKQAPDEALRARQGAGAGSAAARQGCRCAPPRRRRPAALATVHRQARHAVDAPPRTRYAQYARRTGIWDCAGISPAMSWCSTGQNLGLWAHTASGRRRRRRSQPEAAAAVVLAPSRCATHAAAGAC